MAGLRNHPAQKCKDQILAVAIKKPPSVEEVGLPASLRTALALRGDAEENLHANVEGLRHLEELRQGDRDQPPLVPADRLGLYADDLRKITLLEVTRLSGLTKPHPDGTEEFEIGVDWP